MLLKVWMLSFTERCVRCNHQMGLISDETIRRRLGAVPSAFCTNANGLEEGRTTKTTKCEME
jgi:hypothetical protein